MTPLDIFPPLQNQELVFGTHELGSELLVNYLSRVHKPDKVHPNVIDRVLRDSFDTIPPFTLSNGWKLLSKGFLYDSVAKSISIPTVLSSNRIIEITKSPDSPVALELAILRFIYYSRYGISPSLHVIAIDKLFSHYKQMSTDQVNLFEVTDVHSIAHIEELLLSRTNDLQTALETSQIPEKCTKIRFHRQKGRTVNMTCTHYCQYSENCKHFSKSFRYSRTKRSDIIF